MRPGCQISLLGIDGAGKTTLALALADTLRSRGLEPELVSWKLAMAKDGLLAGEVLSSISMAAYKLQFAAAEPAGDAAALQSLLRVDSARTFFHETEAQLREVSVRSNAAHALLSAGLIELAGNMYLHHAHVMPILRRGGVVIVESSGFKHVLKNALMAARLSDPGSPMRREADALVERASVCFGEVLKPTAGFWVDADPRQALDWRRRGQVSSTNFEDYGLTGEARDEPSFLTLQHDCRSGFESFSRRWGWTRLPMQDGPKERNLDVALARIEATLRDHDQTVART